MKSEYEAALDRLLDALDASAEVRELARAFVYRAVAAELHDGWGVEKLTASAVFVAFRRAGNAHSLEEITAVTDLTRTALGRAHRRLTQGLDIELAPANPHEFVERFADSLGIADRTEVMAHEIIDEVVEAELHSGVSPAGVAAAAVYFADSEHHDSLTQKELADSTGVTVVTLRHRYAEQTTLLGAGEHGSIPPNRRKLLDGD
jgi:transcription initiation factor TFIIB